MAFIEKKRQLEAHQIERQKTYPGWIAVCTLELKVGNLFNGLALDLMGKGHFM